MVVKICVIAHVARNPNIGVGKVLFNNYGSLKTPDATFAYFFAENLFPSGFNSNFYLRVAVAPMFTSIIARGYNVANIHGSDCFLIPKKIPCITTFHGLDRDSYLALNKFGLLPERYKVAFRANIIKQKLAIARSDYFFAISNSVRLGIKREKSEAQVFLTPNGVDTNAFSKRSDNDTERVRKRFNVKNKAPIVLFVGRSHPIKGVHLLNQLIGILQKEFGKNITFIFVSSDNKILKSHINASFYPYCYFFENVLTEDLICLYNLASVHIAPSLYEPFGLTGLEAMSCGTPTVAFDVGGFKDYLTDGVSGYLIKPFDVEQFGKRVSSLLSNDNPRCSMGERGRQKALRFDWKVTSVITRDAFTQIISAYKKGR